MKKLFFNENLHCLLVKFLISKVLIFIASTLSIASEIFVPNVFSPNGDGQNDKLYANLVGVKEFKIYRIFNRAGQKVFETTNPAEGWDGTINGVPQALDTYVWMVEAVSKYGAPIRETGLVTLLR